MASGGVALALQLLKLSFFFIFLILFSTCISQTPKLTTDKTRDVPEVTKGEVPFKFGQEFKYNVTGYRYRDSEGRLEKIFKVIYKLTGQTPYWMAFDGEKTSQWEEAYVVEGLEEIENRSSYKVRVKLNGTVLKPSMERFFIENLLYYDIVTGELLKAELGVDKLSPQVLVGKEAEEYGIGPSQMFSSWMLDPKKNFRITINITIELIGMEKLFERNCFKVKLNSSNYEAINWIDVDKRILVKGEYALTDQSIRYEILLKDIKVGI